MFVRFGFTFAAAILNVFLCFAIIMLIGMIFLDAYVVDYWMLLLPR